MSILKIDTSQRSNKSEIMDDFDLNGEELRMTLNDLEKVNNLLGGNRVTIQALKKILQNIKSDRKLTIADLGCGNGAMLRKVAEWGNKNDYKFNLIGIDANPYAIEIARELSKDYPEISFTTENIFSESFAKLQFDISICTLTLHHFKDDEIFYLLNLLYDQSKIGLIVNDLERSKIAYVLFQIFCAVFVNNEIARQDGLTSILRGFRKADFENYESQLKPQKHYLRWKWAFRYQWILEK